MDSTEKKIWERIRSLWDGHCARTEASLGGVDPGFPDCILSPKGWGAIYVELKVWPEPLNPIQYAWHVDCRQRGGIAFVISQVAGGRGKVEKYWIGRGEEYSCLDCRPLGKDLQEVLLMVKLAASGKKVLPRRSRPPLN